MFSFISSQVPDCIDKLAQAGIKIWVLTGDKMETAINIGYQFLGITLKYYLLLRFLHTVFLQSFPLYEPFCMYFFDSFSCSLLRQDMKQIIINLETPEIHLLEKTGEKDAIVKVNKKGNNKDIGIFLNGCY